MKKTKILVPALGMLLLSTAASVTGTVAWFSTVTTVTASSMTIKASVGANLYIKEGAGVALADLVGQAATLTANNQSVSPADMSNSSGTVTVQFPATYTTNPTVSAAGSAATWAPVGTLTASTPTNNADPARNLNDFCVYSFVTIARKQTTVGTYDLAPTCTISCGASSNLNKSLRCGMIMNGSWLESEDKDLATGDIVFQFNSAMIQSLNDNQAYDACLVVWFEGEDSDCYTNNAISLSSNVASWSFTATDHVNP